MLTQWKCFFYAHCLSHINYASTVWSGAGDVHLKKLNSLHRRAAKIIVPSPFLSTSEKLLSANILPLKQQFELNIALLVYKTRYELAPQYLARLLSRADSRYESNNYILPRTRIDLYKTSFAFSGASVWNSLPVSVRSCTSLLSFKSSAKKYFLLAQIM